jgi:hypothetical protein
VSAPVSRQTKVSGTVIRNQTTVPDTFFFSGRTGGPAILRHIYFSRQTKVSGTVLTPSHHIIKVSGTVIGNQTTVPDTFFFSVARAAQRSFAASISCAADSYRNDLRRRKRSASLPPAFRW